MSHSFSNTRFLAFMHKEMLQVIRDPSSILIAFVLPLLMIFLFGFGMSLDANKIPIGIALEDTATEARSLTSAFQHSPYFKTKVSLNRQELIDELVSGRIRGLIVIPQTFSNHLLQGMEISLQVIADGSETNTASFVQNYAEGTVANWLLSQQKEKATPVGFHITAEPRVWFNPELKSRNILLPGSISVIMSLIGTLLTALVVAREWERGTMEAIMATPIRLSELIIGKLMPYFMLGMGSMVLCVSFAVFIMGVPFAGSVFVLFLATALFLLAGLSQGLLISTAARNQFVASQTALNAAFLPAFMLSGFLYEIGSMPTIIRGITYILPARYFVSILQTSFLAGTIWPCIWPNLLGMIGISCVFLFLVIKKTAKRLD